MKKTMKVFILLLTLTMALAGCSGGGGGGTPLSSTKAITAFSFATPAATGIITEATHTITVTVPYGTNLTALIPTITHTGASISPASGVAQNFITPVTYTVTAADSSTQAYIVTVTVPLTAFVTSGVYDGNLGGLAGADTKCQTEATAAHLQGTYKAWLSTSTVDAYCHIQGYTGTIATNCGQGTLPVAAGPWVRTDGFPFAGTIANLINNHQVYAPVAYDATGTFTTALFYFTGTNIDGTYAGAGLTCADWTSNAAASAIGASISGASSGWTWVGGANCTALAGIQLLCMQTGAGVPLPTITAPASAKKVFVTSTTYNGNLGGIAGADALCQARAALIVPAVDSTKFKAWLSDGSTNAIDHVTDVATTDGPFYRLDGVKIADNKGTLTATLGTPLFTAISYTEMGTYIDIINYPVWTGTNENGNKSAFHCNGWVDGTNGQNGQVGFAALADGNWTNWGHVFCANTSALYCFEDD